MDNSVISDGSVSQSSTDPYNAVMQPALHNVQWPEDERLRRENKDYVLFCYCYMQEGVRWITIPRECGRDSQHPALPHHTFSVTIFGKANVNVGWFAVCNFNTLKTITV
jgi:hypothetical protein